VNFLMMKHVHLIRNVRIHNPCQSRAVQDIIRARAQFCKVGCSVCT
jgi:hypothetical protein